MFINMANSDVESLYPKLSSDDGHSFRLRKICDVQSTLENEIAHYGKVRKRYKRAHAALHKASVATGSASVILSGSSLATSLTGFGLVVGGPLAGVAGLLGVASAALATCCKQLLRKVSKHEQTVTLAKSKQNTISELISRALKDNNVSDMEFSLILRELEKYQSLKSEIRAPLATKSVKKPQEARKTKDIAQKVRQELEMEIRKKLGFE